MAAAFRPIVALTTPADINARWDEVAVMRAERFPKADALAFTAFPREHRRQIRGCPGVCS